MPDSQILFVSWEQGLTGNENSLKMLRAALLLMGSAALPLRAPARGPRLRTCNKPWKGCPEEGGSRLGEKLAGFSEAMAMYDGSTSDKSCSTCARACLLYTSPSPRDLSTSRMPSSA